MKLRTDHPHGIVVSLFFGKFQIAAPEARSTVVVGVENLKRRQVRTLLTVSAQIAISLGAPLPVRDSRE